MRRYDGIQFLRAFAAVCIVMFHVWLNTPQYGLNNFFFEQIVSWMGDFTFLFMMISGFSVYCGYYERIINGNISICKFYARRVNKLWPVFCTMVVLELIVSPSLKSLYQGVMDLSLLFSLLPNAKIDVIGVGWTMGVIFVFYIFFPYFVYLMQSKKKAWVTAGSFLLIHFICVEYFFTSEFVEPSFWARKNFLYCAIYFVIGALIYLYKEKLELYSQKNMTIIILAFVPMLIWLCIPDTVKNVDIIFTVAQLTIFSGWIIVALNNTIIFFSSRIVKFLSDLSVEIYLSHMMFFRIADIFGITSAFDNNLANYIFCTIFVLITSVVFSYVLHNAILRVTNLIKSK